MDSEDEGTAPPPRPPPPSPEVGASQTQTSQIFNDRRTNEGPGGDEQGTESGETKTPSAFSTSLIKVDSCSNVGVCSNLGSSSTLHAAAGPQQTVQTEKGGWPYEWYSETTRAKKVTGSKGEKIRREGIRWRRLEVYLHWGCGSREKALHIYISCDVLCGQPTTISSVLRGKSCLG